MKELFVEAQKKKTYIKNVGSHTHTPRIGLHARSCGRIENEK